jgi:hypothetical protein
MAGVIFDTGIKFGSTCIDGLDGLFTWENPSYFCADDSSYAIATTGELLTTMGNFKNVRLIIGGTPVGDNLASGQIAVREEYWTFGGASILWGLTPTAAELNASDFGLQVGMEDTNSIYYTDSLLLTNFSMGIPFWALIEGIKVEIRGKILSKSSYMNCARITVYYSSPTYYMRLLMPRYHPPIPH